MNSFHAVINVHNTIRQVDQGLLGYVGMSLTFWRRNYFFFNFSAPVYKMYIMQVPNKLEL